MFHGLSPSGLEVMVGRPSGRVQRAQRKPPSLPRVAGENRVLRANTPAPEPFRLNRPALKLPPRTSTDGRFVPSPWSVAGLTPRIKSSPNSGPAVPTDGEKGTVFPGIQSAVHSSRLPTISNAPKLETHRLREPVGTTCPAVEVLQSFTPSSAPG